MMKHFRYALPQNGYGSVFFSASALSNIPSLFFSSEPVTSRRSQLRNGLKETIVWLGKKMKTGSVFKDNNNNQYSSVTIHSNHMDSWYELIWPQEQYPHNSTNEDKW